MHGFEPPRAITRRPIPAATGRHGVPRARPIDPGRSMLATRGGAAPKRSHGPRPTRRAMPPRAEMNTPPAGPTPTLDCFRAERESIPAAPAARRKGSAPDRLGSYALSIENPEMKGPPQPRGWGGPDVFSDGS